MSKQYVFGEKESKVALKEIEKSINKAPTMMSPNEEIQYFEELMKLPWNTVLNSWESFNHILGHLSDSHTEAFFEVNSDNMPSFLKFAAWLDKAAEESKGPGKEMALKSFADHFRMNPSDYY